MKNDYVIVNVMNDYVIKERKTDQLLISFDQGAHAHRMCELLNDGSGFAGETPAFFAKKIVQASHRKYAA